MRAMYFVFLILASFNGCLLALCVYERDVCPLRFGIFVAVAFIVSFGFMMHFINKIDNANAQRGLDAFKEKKMP